MGAALVIYNWKKSVSREVFGWFGKAHVIYSIWSDFITYYVQKLKW